jgi:hypothetical protein
MGWDDFTTWMKEESSELFAVQKHTENQLGGGTAAEWAAGPLGLFRYLQGPSVAERLQGESWGPLQDPPEGSKIDLLIDEYGDPYVQLMGHLSQEIRDAVYAILWLAFTAPAALMLPVLTWLNANLLKVDPLLKPPKRHHEGHWILVDHRINADGSPVEYDVIDMEGLGGTLVDWDPLSEPAALYGTAAGWDLYAP